MEVGVGIEVVIKIALSIPLVAVYRVGARKRGSELRPGDEVRSNRVAASSPQSELHLYLPSHDGLDLTIWAVFI